MNGKRILLRFRPAERDDGFLLQQDGLFHAKAGGQVNRFLEPVRGNSGQVRAIQNFGIVAADADVDAFPGADSSFVWPDDESRRLFPCFKGEVGRPGSAPKVVDEFHRRERDDRRLRVRADDAFLAD